MYVAVHSMLQYTVFTGHLMLCRCPNYLDSKELTETSVPSSSSSSLTSLSSEDPVYSGRKPKTGVPPWGTEGSGCDVDAPVI